VSWLYGLTVRAQRVRVSEKGVSYPSFPPKQFGWDQFQNVILRDGLLTLDWKNNRLLQQPADDTETSVNEADFNDFCRKQLQAPLG